MKAFRWAADRISEEGVIALVASNSFLDGFAFDGMRKHLANDFDAIYILDLGGNVRTNPKLSGTTHNVFGIQVGVSINLLIKRKGERTPQVELFYARVDEFWRKERKYRYLNEKDQYSSIEWVSLTPDNRYTWLTEGLRAEFETLVPIGMKETKAGKREATNVLFKTFSLGVNTNRDAWARNFNPKALTDNMERMIETYNEQVFKWERRDVLGASVDDFVVADSRKISWSESLKANLERGRLVEFTKQKARASLYRPFTKSNLYFDRVMNERVYVFPFIFPTPETERENRVIIVPSAGGRADYWCFCADTIPSLTLTSIDGSQCFPYYTYDEDGSNRRENITDWALARFRAQYGDETISKWDIFHYVYGLLHHPVYRERYQANLKRELPRIPFAPDFRAFTAAGARLAAIHVGYEEQPEHPLQQIETPQMPLDWRVEKMRLSKDKTQLRYNGFLTLDGIPAEAFNYRLGNRSALEWVIDQYRVKTDKRSGIVNDPNRADEPEYIVRLIGNVISVSMETVEIVAGLPDLGIEDAKEEKPPAVHA